VGNGRGRGFAPAIVALLLAGCTDLPQGVERPVSAAITDGADTPVGRALAASVAAHPGRSGVLALADAREAFAARALLARAAARSLDVQVYRWRDDATGLLLFAEALRAADRGVRVRLLIDDNGTAGLDPLLAMLDAHPNIALRVFNPFARRRLRLAAYAVDFTRLNRRMHNKSFTVDGQVTIVGGRNIGDEYFAAGQAASFSDLDLLVVGHAVAQVSATFDRYWNAAAADPISALAGATAPMAAAVFDTRVTAVRDDPAAAAHQQALAGSPLAGGLPWEWTTARVFADSPDNVLAPPGTAALQMLPRLTAELGTPLRTLDLVSPYFVPGTEGTDALVGLAGSGVRVRVLTNSLAATDVAAVHAGYARRREALLRGGVRLMELRPTAIAASPVTSATATSSGERGPWPVPGGSSRASLHADTFAVGGERIFVGSFNLDPRSAELNTEMGFVEDSPELAQRLSAGLDRLVPTQAWGLETDAQGRLRWIDGSATPPTREPAVGPLRRAMVRVLSWLPIEWLL